MDGKETIGLGFWLHLKGITDDVPYLVITGGPLFDALKRHYRSLIDAARAFPSSAIQRSEVPI
jgi:hypothetical protein